MRDKEPVPNSVLVSGIVVLVLNLLVWTGAGSFLMAMWELAGRPSNCGPRIGVACPSGTGYSVAGPAMMLFGVLALLAHLWREGVRGPMPAAVVPVFLGAVLAARFLWSAVSIADSTQSRVVMAVAGVLSALLPGVLYGRWLFRRWGTALLLWSVRIDRGGTVAASGPAEERARNVLLALSLTGAVLGCCAGMALV
ncbi:hypothetical protein OEB94_15140 [Streptomyces sp. ICN988]|uniref:hypothetical protein n=1 Tax=unclassified Streptomyces TaxID=2593676 RepID=UPI0021E363EA|nr:hypothetical protein [Streptomyces sp. ICN988]MCV2460614.1 hypothetical protein [Streptomyces sp. ICN988]